MKVFLFIFLLFIIFNQSFSINNFLDYLKNTGYYETIEYIKLIFGDDVAIEVCRELLQTNDCEVVVKVYMLPWTSPSRAPIRREEGTNKLTQILFQEENLKILTQFYTKREIMDLAIRVINKVIKQ